jgi:hypothetical protein
MPTNIIPHNARTLDLLLDIIRVSTGFGLSLFVSNAAMGSCHGCSFERQQAVILAATVFDV